MHSEAFLNDRVNIYQLVAVIKVGKPLKANDLVNFCLCTLLHFGVASQKKDKCPG